MSLTIPAPYFESLLLILGGVTLFVVRYTLKGSTADRHRRERLDRLLRLAAPGLVIGGLYLAIYQSTTPSPAEQCVRTIMADAPYVVDDTMVLERAEVAAGNRVIIHFTTIATRSAEVDRARWNNTVVPTVRANVLKSRMSRYLSQGVTLVYRYSGSDGVHIDDVVFEPVRASAHK